MDGLVKYGIFANDKQLWNILNFLRDYTFPEDVNDGYFEDLFQQGFSQEQVDAVIDTGLVEYESNEVDVPEVMRAFVDGSTEIMGTFKLTVVGDRVLQQLNGKGL